MMPAAPSQKWLCHQVLNRLGTPSPEFFVSVASKGVTDADSVSVAFKGVAGGRFRLISLKTRRSAVSVASKGVTGAEVEEFKVEELKRRS